MKKYVLPALLVCVVVSAFSVSVTSTAKKPILNHIALSVMELKRSTNFYQQIIQIDTIPEPFHDGKHTWFSIAEHSHLHLIETGADLKEKDKNTHLCFSVESIEEVIKRLDKAGIAWSNWQGTPRTQTVRVDGVKQIYFQDPDGYWIEINNDKY